MALWVNINCCCWTNPTASLDAANRQVVLSLIEERKADGTAMLGIFHDTDTRDRVLIA